MPAHGDELFAFATAKGVSLGFEASVAGGTCAAALPAPTASCSPSWASELKRRKAAVLARHAPEAVATANIGCQTHLASARRPSIRANGPKTMV